jgi:kinesin family protein 15
MFCYCISFSFCNSDEFYVFHYSYWTLCRRVDELTVELEAAKKCDHENKKFEVAQLQEQSVLLDAQTELKTLVDAIATASQREAEAHETAIGLAKENEELRTELKVLIDDNKRLVELYEQAIVNIGVKQDSSVLQTEDVNEQQNSHPSCGGSTVNGCLQMVHPLML